MFCTLRRSLLTIFCAYVSFLLAGVAFQKMTEYHDFQEAAQAHPIVGLSFSLVVLGAVIALLAVLAGGLPITVAVVRSAIARKRGGPLLLLALPFLAFAVFLGTTLLLEAIGHPGTHLAPVWQLFLFFGVFIIAAAVSTGSVCLAVIRSDIPEKLLRFALLPSIWVTISMALMLAATLIWGLGIHMSAPQLVTSNNGIVGSSTVGTWSAIVIAMALATGLSVVSLMRGLSARSALQRATA